MEASLDLTGVERAGRDARWGCGLSPDAMRPVSRPTVPTVQ